MQVDSENYEFENRQKKQILLALFLILGLSSIQSKEQKKAIFQSKSHLIVLKC